MRDRTSQTDDSTSQHEDVTADTFLLASLAFGRTVVPVPNRNRERLVNKLGYEYMEHCFIGDATSLTLSDGRKVAASDFKLQFPNGLAVTYGQINGLADFYGTFDPISDGRDESERSTRFERAFETLAGRAPRQPQEAQDILNVLQAEVDAVNEALKNHQDPSVVYSQLPDVSAKLDSITWGRRDTPRYRDLVQINWDHFGEDAMAAYNAGHKAALRKALTGDLEGAYAVNAFADHFLEDWFSAGHLRTPRRALHKPSDISADICAKFMHDEDNAIGLRVQNAAGESWTVYGDKRALDWVDEENKRRCVDAVQASVDEIYTTWRTKLAPSSMQYKAWSHAPTLASARSRQELAPLVTFAGARRKEVKGRRDWTFKVDWWFWSTALECKNSGWWNYPITLDGGKGVLPWSAIGVAAADPHRSRVLYQRTDGHISEMEYIQGTASGGSITPSLFAAAPWTPLTVAFWDSANQIRVYYVDKDYMLREHCCRVSVWYPGRLDKLKIRVAPHSALAVKLWVDSDGVHIRLYYQGLLSDAIQELCFEDGWTAGAQLPVALRGSKLAAAWSVFYQTEDLSLKECVWVPERQEWCEGSFNPGKAPGRTPICATNSYDESGTHTVVYWRNAPNDIVEAKHLKSWGPAHTVLGGLDPGMQLAAAQPDGGQSDPMVYYQVPDSSIRELRRSAGS